VDIATVVEGNHLDDELTAASTEGNNTDDELTAVLLLLETIETLGSWDKPHLISNWQQP
jgi:hypothetical protein